jgi:hypothetical protein
MGNNKNDLVFRRLKRIFRISKNALPLKFVGSGFLKLTILVKR